MHLSGMQQNQNNCGYPQVFWTNSSALSSSDCAPQVGLYHSNGTVAHQDICLPLPVPESKRHRQNHKDGTRLGFLVVFLLILLALMGVGLAMFQIFHLQKEFQEFSSSGPVPPPSPDMLKGALNRTAEKKVKRSAHLTDEPKESFWGQLNVAVNDPLYILRILPNLGKANQQSHPLEWETTYGHSFFSGVQYKNRGLVIDEAGLYFVYSKVFFRGRTCTSQALDHIVFKRNPSYPDNQVLMEDRMMNYCVTMRMWGKSSYLGALFNLSRQDSVYVSVSEPTLVNSEESKTFFGLYML